APGVPSAGEHGARPLAEILDGGPAWSLAGAEHRCAIRQRRLPRGPRGLDRFLFHCYPRPRLACGATTGSPPTNARTPTRFASEPSLTSLTPSSRPSPTAAASRWSPSPPPANYARPGITYRPVTGISPSHVGVAWPPANHTNPIVRD